MRTGCDNSGLLTDMLTSIKEFQTQGYSMILAISAVNLNLAPLIHVLLGPLVTQAFE